MESSALSRIDNNRMIQLHYDKKGGGVCIVL